MPMTVIVTRNVEDRYRGFLASCMLEIAPGVYTGPRMTPGVRDRVWQSAFPMAPQAWPRFHSDDVARTLRNARRPRSSTSRRATPKSPRLGRRAVWFGESCS